MLLSICIPTYNRACLLDQNLKCLCSQIVENVELIISDNCSDDNTRNVVMSYIKVGYNIKYFRNESNIGGELNFLQCFKMSSGKYVLLLGDDDFLCERAITTILSLIKENSNWGLIFLNAGRDLNMPEGLIEYEVHKSVESLLAQIHYGFTFISSCVINRSHFGSLNLEKYIGTFFVHVPFVLRAMTSSSQNVLIKSPLIVCGINSEVNYPLFKVFGVNLIDLLIDFTRTQRRIVKYNIILDLYPYWATAIRDNKMVCSMKENVVKQVYEDFGLFASILLFLILHTPYPIYFVFRKIQILIKRVYRCICVTCYSNYDRKYLR